MKTVLIVGAGFSGTSLAVHLLRAKHAVPLRVILLNRSGVMARGVAYGTRSPVHVLNVPVGRLGISPEAPDDFLAFARREQPGLSADAFVSRALYGRYLADRLDAAAREAGPTRSLQMLVGEARALRSTDDGCGVVVRLENDETILADEVVLALGHFAPVVPRLPGDESRRLARSPRFINDPWHPAACDAVADHHDVALLGSGLTMLDMAGGLLRSGHRGRIVVLSRSGNLPLAHRSQHWPALAPASGLAARMLLQATARGYLRALRAEVTSHEQRGGDWRDVLDALRGDLPRLWQALPAQEQARFLCRLQSQWNRHRHRAAPEAVQPVVAACASGRIQLLRGRLSSAHDAGTGLQLAWRTPLSPAVAHDTVDFLINCTGPRSDPSQLRDPLLRRLQAEGQLRWDCHRLGLELADDYALLDAHGKRAERIRYIGPMLRARFWEATAVPELRQHAAALAQVLEARITGDRAGCDRVFG